MCKDEMTRREFLKRALAVGAGAYALTHAGLVTLGRSLLLSPSMALAAEAGGRPTIVVAAKGDLIGRVRAAVEGVGGIKKFVKRGARVLIKPNIAWTRRPEQAANTNPEVVAELVRMCRAAGAREVKVMDNPVDGPASRVASLSGIAEAAEKAGAKVTVGPSPAMFERIKIKRGKILRQADVLRDLVRADVFINVPIAKVHGGTGVTIGLKNLMGTVLDRGAWHQSDSLDQCIADYATEIRPHLVVLDATRVLLTNGPKGPGQTKDLNLIVAGTDPLAIDAYGVKLLDLPSGRQGKMRAEEIGHLRRAKEMGVGELDLGRVNVKHV